MGRRRFITPGISLGEGSCSMSIVFLRTAARTVFCRRRTRGGAGISPGGLGALRPGDEGLERAMAVLLPAACATGVPAGTQSGRRLRLRGRGLPRSDDFPTVARIVVPEHPSAAERATYEALRRAADAPADQRAPV
jgi:hypothetical protein